ncbi:hypothetical protein [Pelagicoccus albus]|uniref:Uncharacterized protein n=1 Tax=Pelagicoccus albus TaxID=415222 RepID=A0A7X1B5B8_9BACT|nr:hypothetical protein [Pelagicoccus albus]MBC2605933.1 hypothetical protein [Pelagicoccus albus]
MSLTLPNRIGLGLCLALLAFQAIAIVYARFTPARYFCWAPYDTQDRYEVTIEREGLTLSESEATERYRFHSNAWQQHSIYNLLNAIEQYETSYGIEDGARITVTYSRNGHPQEVWSYPR